jgi:hypothetical protein
VRRGGGNRALLQDAVLGLSLTDVSSGKEPSGAGEGPELACAAADDPGAPDSGVRALRPRHGKGDLWCCTVPPQALR